MFVVVFVTVPSLKVANSISKAILSKRLCACVSITQDVHSFFWWQGRIDKAKERILIIKTKKSLFKRLARQITKLHPYDVPEIIAISLVGINKDYAAWLKKEMAAEERSKSV